MFDYNKPAPTTYTLLNGITVYKGQTGPEAEAEYRERQKWIGQYGSPEYGGWRNSLLDGRHKPLEVCEREEVAAMTGGTCDGSGRREGV